MKHIILSSMLLPGAMMVSQAATLSFPEVPAAKEEAAKIKAALEAAGAKVEVK